MIWVFGRGVYESRSPIYIYVRVQVRLWGGVFSHDQFYLVGWSGWIRKSPSGQSSHFPKKKSDRMKPESQSSLFCDFRHVPAHTVRVYGCRTTHTQE